MTEEETMFHIKALQTAIRTMGAEMKELKDKIIKLENRS